MLNVSHIKNKLFSQQHIILLLGFVVSLNVVIPSPVYASAWTLSKGKKQTIITATYYSTNHFIDADGKKSKVNKFRKYEISPYTEYGLRDGITIGASIPFQYLEQKDNNGNKLDNIGLAGVEIFSRFRLLDNDNYVISVQPLVKFPAIYSVDSPRAGHDNFDTEIALQAGYNFDWLGKSHYVDSSVGYRHRFGGLHDQIKLSLNAGLKINDRFTIMPQIDYTQAVNANLRNNITISGQNDYDLAKAQISVLYRINDYYRLQLGGYRHIYSRATGDDNGLLAAIWTNF